MRDAWRLAAGTFVAIPVRPPTRVTTSIAGRAMALAPLTTAPALLGWALLAVAASRGWVSPLLAAAMAVTVTALVSRAMHLDGLADTADGLCASYDPERGLEVMRRGDTGPAGAAAIVLTLLIQVAALAPMLATMGGAVLAGTALVASRLAPAVLCRRGIAAARPDGLGATVAGSVSPLGLGLSTSLVTLVGAAACQLTGMPWYAAVLVTGAAILCSWIVSGRAVRRFGGITGDVLGAAIELSLAAALVTTQICGATLLGG